MGDPSTTADAPTGAGADERRDRRILYLVRGSESAAALHLAASVASARDAELVVGHVGAEASGFSTDANREAALTRLKAQKDPMIDVPVQSRSLQGSSPLDAVLTAVATYEPELVVMGEDASETLESQVAGRVACDTAVANEKTPMESVASVLVPVAGGPHTEAVVDVAGAVADANDAWIELFHVTDPSLTRETSESARSLLDAHRERLPPGVDVDTRVVEADDVVDRIVEEAWYHDVTVIGAPTKGRLQRFVFGSTATEIRDHARNTVVMVRDN